MALQTLTYSTPQRLTCDACLPADVSLCVPVSIDANASILSQTGIIEAQITAVVISGIYRVYTITYEDDQLVEGVTLTADMIQGILCHGCLLSYINYVTSSSNFAEGPDPGAASLGTELITNGTFDTNLVGWNVGAGWSWSAGTALHTPGSIASLSQTIAVVGGTTYFLFYTVSGAMAGSSEIRVNGVLIPTYNYIEIDAAGHNRASWTAPLTGNVLFEIVPSILFDSAYDNVSVRPVIELAAPIFTLIDAEGNELASFRGLDSQHNLGIGLNSLLYTLNDSFVGVTYASDNFALGKNALGKNTSGYQNVAFGKSTLSENGAGYQNVAVGYEVLKFNTSGFGNTSVGSNSMTSNIGGAYNNAFGYGALFSNTFGISNVAIGNNALSNTTLSNYNVAIGSNALGAIGNVGTHNISIGIDSSFSNQTGNYNQVVGYKALHSHTAGDSNCIFGIQSAELQVTGSNNSAYGSQALAQMTSGSNNIAIGFQAGYPQLTGDNNVIIGISQGTGFVNGSNKIAIAATIYGDSVTSQIGIGLTVPTATLQLRAGAATAGRVPLKLTAGAFVTVPEVGSVEYSNRFTLTDVDAARRHIVQAVSSTKTVAGAPYANDGYVEMVIDGVTLRVMTTA